jgi:hypothetical protein
MAPSFRSADVVVIAEAHDRVAAEFYRRSCARGVRASWPDRGAFARGISIAIDGATTTVDPDVPVFLRRQAMTSGQSEDGRFLAVEANAQVWAATALMTSPVVNRPSWQGMPDWHPRIQTIRLRSSGRVDPRLLIPERHTDAASLPADGYESECLGWAPAGTGGCGYRSRRRKPADWRYERCCVVGDKVLSTAAREDIADLSHRVARALAVEFCLIHWRVPPDGDAAEVARVNTHPDAAELGEFYDDAVDLLLEVLLP